MKRTWAVCLGVSLVACSGNPRPKLVPAAAQCKEALSSTSKRCPRYSEKKRPFGAYGLGWDNHSLLEGFGLEGLHFNVEGAPAATALPKSGDTLTSVSVCDGAPTVRVKIVSCDDEVRGASKCVIQPIGDALPCGPVVSGCSEKTPTVQRAVIMVHGYWDQTGTWQPDKKTFTLSCSAAGRCDQVSGVDGAITECVQSWRYDPESRPEEFQACVRAVRADYCGDGTSHTIAGTDIDLHDHRYSKMAGYECKDAERTLEAAWNKLGAVCVAHQRIGGDASTLKCVRDGKPIAVTACDKGTVDNAMVMTRSRCGVCDSNGVETRYCPPDGDPCCAAGGENDPICVAKDGGGAS